MKVSQTFSGKMIFRRVDYSTAVILQRAGPCTWIDFQLPSRRRRVFMEAFWLLLFNFSFTLSVLRSHEIGMIYIVQWRSNVRNGLDRVRGRRHIP